MNRIVHGDVIEVLDSLPASLQFDLVIADPPYNIGKDFGTTQDSMSLHDYVTWSCTWIDACRDRLLDHGVMYIYGLPEILAHISVQYPWDQQRWMVWHYTNKQVPQVKFWQRSHEAIMAIWRKGQKKPALAIDQIREPYTPNYRCALGKPRVGGAKGRYASDSSPTVYHDNGGALPRDVLKYPALAGGAGSKQRWFSCRDCGGGARPPREKKEHLHCDVMQHPTQKPRQLTERLISSMIRDSSGKVLVPFAGSGSECVVANNMGIPWLGIEINKEYVEFARDWLTKSADCVQT